MYRDQIRNAQIGNVCMYRNRFDKFLGIEPKLRIYDMYRD